MILFIYLFLIKLHCTNIGLDNKCWVLHIGVVPNDSMQVLQVTR
jgi:hypothetical protein